MTIPSVNKVGHESEVWILFQLHSQLFGISARHVREMIGLPQVIPVPQVPAFVRGVINLRDVVVPTLDLRRLLGMPSFDEQNNQLIEMLKKREEDHRNWLHELENSVKNDVPFNLAKDPHQCAFGKWYYSFKTDNVILKNSLQKFERPHAEIHELADKVLHLQDEKQKDKALHLIVQARSTILNHLIGLFAKLFLQLQSTKREIGLIVETEHHRTVAVAVDSVLSVEALLENSIEPLTEVLGGAVEGLVTHVGRRRADKSLVLLLNPSALSSGLPEVHV